MKQFLELLTPATVAKIYLDLYTCVRKERFSHRKNFLQLLVSRCYANLLSRFGDKESTMRYIQSIETNHIPF